MKKFTVEPASFQRSVQTNGIVDFDNDQAVAIEELGARLACGSRIT